MNTTLKSICVFVLLSTAYLCQSNNLKLISRWPEGPCHTAAVENNYAYINSGSAFEILDISDTNSFKLTGKLDLHDQINNVKVYGGYAYIAGDKGIYVVDISNKLLPGKVSTISSEGWTNSLFIKDNFLYAADYIGLKIFDISNPSLPKPAGSYNINFNVTGIFVKDSLAYLACPDSGLFVINIQNKTDLSLKGRYNFNNKYNPKDVFVKDSLAYITSSENKPGLFSYGKLHILDIIDPANIFERSSIELHGDWQASGNKVIVNENFVYLSHYSDVGDYMLIIDAGDPDKPKELAKISVDRISDLSIKNKTIYASAEHYGLLSFNVNNPLSVRQVNSFRTAGNTNSVFRKGDYLFNANSKGGLKVLNISDPLLPAEVFTYSRQFGYEACNSVFVKDTVLYAGFSVSGPGLVNFGLSNLPHLTKIGELFITDLSNINVAGSRLFAATYDGFSICDVTDPAHPAEIYHYSIGDIRYPEIAIEDNSLFVAAKEKGLLVFNVSDPAKTVLVKTIPVKFASSVTTAGKYVYVNSYGEGLRIFDITEPVNPKEAGLFKDSLYASKIKVQDGYAFIAYPNSGMKILNIEKPDSVHLVNIENSLRTISDIFVDKDFIIVSENSLGLSIFKNDIASSTGNHKDPVKDFSLLQNYPNPFNPATIISYELPEKSYVELKVFDLLGREVTTLVNKEQSAGEYKIPFNASSLPSGMYIYTIRAGQFRDSGKLLLLR